MDLNEIESKDVIDQLIEIFKVHKMTCKRIISIQALKLNLTNKKVKNGY